MTKEFCDICGRPIETQPDGKIMTKSRVLYGIVNKLMQ